MRRNAPPDSIDSYAHDAVAREQSESDHKDFSRQGRGWQGVPSRRRRRP